MHQLAEECQNFQAQHVHIYWISSFSLNKREEGSFCYTVLFTGVVKCSNGSFLQKCVKWTM
jgi:hypothetical protein